MHTHLTMDVLLEQNYFQIFNIHVTHMFKKKKESCCIFFCNYIFFFQSNQIKLLMQNLLLLNCLCLKSFTSKEWLNFWVSSQEILQKDRSILGTPWLQNKLAVIGTNTWIQYAFFLEPRLVHIHREHFTPLKMIKSVSSIRLYYSLNNWKYHCNNVHI